MGSQWFFLLILCSVFVPGGRWGLALAYEQVWEMKKRRHLHFLLCFMRTITSGRAAGSQFTGVFSSSASERTLLLMKGKNMLFAPCHFFPQLTPALGLLECLQEPLQFIKTGGINLVLAGEVSWSGWCRVEGFRDTLRWRRGHNRGVKSFLTAAWELNLRNFLPSYAFKRQLHFSHLKKELTIRGFGSTSFTCLSTLLIWLSSKVCTGKSS